MIEAADLGILENMIRKVVRQELCRVFGIEDEEATDTRLPDNPIERRRAYERYMAGDKKALSEYVRTHKPDIER